MTTQHRKTAILEAAARIVSRAGASHLTISAVAVEAGMSKGGVLYHFSSKRELLEGMLNVLIDDRLSRAERHRLDIRGQNNVEIRSLILAELVQNETTRTMSQAVLAASAENPNLLDPARELLATVFERVSSDSTDGDFGRALLLALEGLRFLELLDLSPFSSVERKRLYEYLLELAADADTGRISPK